MSRRWPKIFFLISLLIGVGVWSLWRFDAVPVAAVTLSGTNRITVDSVGVRPGENLLAVDLQKVASVISRRNWVASTRVWADHNRQIHVEVKEKYPACYIYADKLYGVTSTAELIPPRLQKVANSMPVIRGVEIERPREYKRVDNAGLRSALELLNYMRTEYMNLHLMISEIVCRDDGLLLVMEPGSTVINFGWGRYQTKLTRLQEILSDNNNPGLYVDLRFVDLAILKSNVSDREVNYGI